MELYVLYYIAFVRYIFGRHDIVFLFFFNDTATTEIYTYGHTLSLHDALPISRARPGRSATHKPRHRSRRTAAAHRGARDAAWRRASRRISSPGAAETDRKSTRLNSSH